MTTKRLPGWLAAALLPMAVAPGAERPAAAPRPLADYVQPHPRSTRDRVFDVWRNAGRFTKNPDIIELPSGRLMLVYSDTEQHLSREDQYLVLLASDDRGRVALFIRNEEPAYRHAVSFSADGATRWTTPVLHPDLYTPISFATAVRLSGGVDSRGKTRLLYVHPDSRAKRNVVSWWGGRPRENETIRLSYDEGATWPIAKAIEPGRSGYADIAVGPNGMIYCLYERGFNPDNQLNTRYLTCARFNLEWLTDGKDSLQR